MKRIKAFSIFLILFLLSLFSIRPLFSSGFFPMHDDTQIARVFLMGKALGNGQFPVRWVSELGYGYGYPLFNFYAPLPYYFGGFLTFFGMDALIATKLMMGLGMLLAGFGMYVLGQQVWGKLGGLIAGFLYLYAPYHAVELYVRGAVGELWAYGLLPFTVGSFIKTGETGKTKWIGMSAVFLSAIILSHNIIGVLTVIGMLLCLTGFYFSHFFRKKNLATNYYLLIAIFLSLGLSAFFWLPALLELSLTKAPRLATEVNFRDHFVYLWQLWNSPWGFAGSGPGLSDGMSFRVGKLHIVLGILGILSSLGYLGNLRKKEKAVITGSTFLVGVSVFMMLSVSQPIWKFVKPLAFIQFPWRFLVFVSFGSSLIGGATIALFKTKRLRFSYFAIVLIFVFFLYSKLFVFQTMFPASTSNFTSSEKLRWDTSKISDEYLPRDFPVPRTLEELPLESVTASGDIIIRNLWQNSHKLFFIAQAQREGLVVINRANFLGWKGFIDGKSIPLETIEGKIAVRVPAGVSEVRFVFSSTPIRTFANMISLGTVVGLGIFLIYEKRKKII